VGVVCGGARRGVGGRGVRRGAWSCRRAAARGGSRGGATGLALWRLAKWSGRAFLASAGAGLAGAVLANLAS
jgi:hypothetical protein